MNQQQIEEVVKGYLRQAQNGASIENPKFDFKREWSKLDTPDNRNEFIADTSAIANTFGLDGYIVIGYDEKTNSFTNSPFSESGLRDTSDLMNLVNKSVDPIYTVNVFAMEYEGNQLTVLHIPPSIAKPHVIRCYKKNGREEQHRTFVRKGSGKQVANRYDTELMYYDRKNITAEYSFILSFHISSFNTSLNKSDYGERSAIRFPLTIENVGRRPVSIAHLSLSLTTLEFAETKTVLNIERRFDVTPFILLSGELELLEMEHITVISSFDFDKQAELIRQLSSATFRTKLSCVEVE